MQIMIQQFPLNAERVWILAECTEAICPVAVHFEASRFHWLPLITERLELKPKHNSPPRPCFHIHRTYRALQSVT